VSGGRGESFQNVSLWWEVMSLLGTSVESDFD